MDNSDRRPVIVNEYGMDGNKFKTLMASLVTPSPGHYGLYSLKTNRTVGDVKMDVITERLDRLREGILKAKRNDNMELDGNYGDFCDDLKTMREPQILLHTLRAHEEEMEKGGYFDAEVNVAGKSDVILTAQVTKGAVSQCCGIIMRRTSHDIKKARETLKEFPKRLNIEFRAGIEESAFSHLIHEDSVVTIVKAADKDLLSTKMEESERRAQSPNHARDDDSKMDESGHG